MVLENAGTAVMGIVAVQEIIELRRQHNRLFLRPYWSLGQLVLADCYIT